MNEVIRDHLVALYGEAAGKAAFTKLASPAGPSPENKKRFSGEGPGVRVAESPVIDYHLMRSCLRTGLVDVIDDELRRKLIGREELSAAEEWGVRFAAYRAIQQVQQRSGRSMGAVDWFFFNARHRCTEMTEPECAKCAIDPVCAHRNALFQPVIRTTFY